MCSTMNYQPRAFGMFVGEALIWFQSTTESTEGRSGGEKGSDWT